MLLHATVVSGLMLLLLLLATASITVLLVLTTMPTALVLLVITSPDLAPIMRGVLFALTAKSIQPLRFLFNTDISLALGSEN